MATTPVTRRTRVLQVLLVAVLAAALLPIAPARASHVTARDTDDACGDAPEDGFRDTGADGTAQEEAVDCIAWYGITTGTSATTYSPGATITRAQMATMIANAMRASEEEFAEPGATEDAFTDDNTSPHEENINFVAKHGVAKGTSAGRFSPSSPILRDQMATFIANMLEAVGADVPAATQDYFTDDESSVHEANINALARLGIVTGRTEGQYFPRTSVTRGQMAFFVSRGLDLLVEEDLLQAPEGAAPEAEAGTHESVDVVSVDREDDSFIGKTDAQSHGNELFIYDSTDAFELADPLMPSELTMAEFEGLLTGPLGEVAGDVLTIEYAPDGNSTFSVDTDNVPLANAAASVVNTDSGQTINDVIVTWEGTQPDATYDVVRDDGVVLGDDMADPSDETVAEDLTTTSVTLEDEPDGTYNYIVVATGTASGSSTELPTNDVTVPGTATSSGSPKSENAVQIQDNPLGSGAAPGDEWRFAFDKALAAPDDGDSLLVQAGGGGNHTLVHSSSPDPDANAVFSLNGSTVTIAGKQYAPGQVLTVQLSRGLGSGPSFAAYPFTVLTSSGVTTAGGAVPNWTTSFDRTVQADTTQPTSTEACQQTDTDDIVNKDDVIRIRFSESMNATQPKPLPESITIRDFEGHQVELVHGQNATFAYSEAAGAPPIPNGRILVTVTNTPAGSAVNYNLSSAITAYEWVIDAAGHEWNLADSSADGKDLTDSC